MKRYLTHPKAGVSAGAALLCAVAVYLVYLLMDYRNLHVHPHSMIDIAPLFKPGWSNYDVIEQMLFRYERPRFLTYLVFKTDLVIREFLNYYFLPHPTLSVAFLLNGFIAPVFLFRGLVNFGLRKGPALACVAVFLTHIGFQSGLTVFYHQGKFIAVSFVIIAFYLGTVLTRLAQENALGSIWSLRKKWQTWALLILNFVGIQLDEYGLYIFVLFPALFHSLFLLPSNRFSRQGLSYAVRNLAFFLSPLLAFIALFVVIFPLFSQQLFGRDYHFFYGQMVIRGSSDKQTLWGIVEQVLLPLVQNVGANILSLFGSTFIPYSQKLFGLGPAHHMWMPFGPQVNAFNVSFVAALVGMVLLVAIRSQGSDSRMLKNWVWLTGAFLLFHALLHGFAYYKTSGYYYGCVFSFVVAVFVGALFKLTDRLSPAMRLIPAFLAIYLCINQSLNFNYLNQRQILTHNQWGADRALKYAPYPINLEHPPRGPHEQIPSLDRKKLRAIWMAWREGRLKDFVAHNQTDPMHTYLVLELLRLPPPVR